MYASKTTFVVGAGASLELGFPTSNDLKNEIAAAVDIRFQGFGEFKSGDYAIAQALRKHADFQKGAAEEYNLNLKAGWHIAKAMHQAISIDNFVDNQEDERVTRMAKLGIASCLIDAESACWKKIKKSDNEHEIMWDKFQENWIHKFQQTLTEDTKRSSLDRIFENIRFIVFNYDRSLEFFLTHCISNYYDISLSEAESIVSLAEFIHPYGQIGRLPWQKGDLPILRFGIAEKTSLYEISQSIMTFSE